jgi:hypothetical protein
MSILSIAVWLVFLLVVLIGGIMLAQTENRQWERSEDVNDNRRERDDA